MRFFSCPFYIFKVPFILILNVGCLFQRRELSLAFPSKTLLSLGVLQLHFDCKLFFLSKERSFCRQAPLSASSTLPSSPKLGLSRMRPKLNFTCLRKENSIAVEIQYNSIQSRETPNSLPPLFLLSPTRFYLRSCHFSLPHRNTPFFFLILFSLIPKFRLKTEQSEPPGAGFPEA